MTSNPPPPRPPTIPYSPHSGTMHKATGKPPTILRKTYILVTALGYMPICIEKKATNGTLATGTGKRESLFLREAWKTSGRNWCKLFYKK